MPDESEIALKASLVREVLFEVDMIVTSAATLMESLDFDRPDTVDPVCTIIESAWRDVSVRLDQIKIVFNSIMRDGEQALQAFFQKSKAVRMHPTGGKETIQ